jgi:hypothetical protein
MRKQNPFRVSVVVFLVSVMFGDALPGAAQPQSPQQKERSSGGNGPHSKAGESMHYAHERGKAPIHLRAQTATGPLRVNPANPRYFTDGSGKANYVTGSHTWANLMDRGTLHPPQVPFDYAANMKWMVAQNFNFMRLWTAELPDSADTGDVDENTVALPWKWLRTGPGLPSRQRRNTSAN